MANDEFDNAQTDKEAQKQFVGEDNTEVENDIDDDDLELEEEDDDIEDDNGDDDEDESEVTDPA